MRRLLSLIAALWVGVSQAGAGTPDRLVGALEQPALWENYKKAFISPGGRVIDNANGDISHSEGQGYGMLLAVAADDPETFDRVWTWTRAQLMLRDDGLAAWRWDPVANPHVNDRNNASDGDILIAWSLAEAGEAWSRASYKTAALQLMLAIADHDVRSSAFGPILRPGTAGFSAKERPDGPVVNLSYWVFPALSRFAALVPDRHFADVSGAGLGLIKTSPFGAPRLPTDWVSLVDPLPKPAKAFPPTFGYDAIRIPLYLVWGGFDDRQTLATFDQFLSDTASPPRRIDLSTGEAFEPFSDSGYRAIGAVVRCALRGTAFPADLRDAEVDRYYPSTLRALALVVAHQRFPRCL